MKKEIVVSILIPVYNVKAYIKQCLESVASQTCTAEIECVIVDDCGDDGSINIVEEFIEKYNGPILFRIIHHNQNRGLAAARNTAVSAARGEFLVHLDSDDWLEPTAVDNLLKRQAETNADIVSGNAIRHKHGLDDILFERNYSSSNEMVHYTIEMTLDHVIWRRLIRRSLYIDNDVFAVEGVNIGEDHHTLPRLAYYANSVAKTNAVVYHYNCLNPNSYMSVKTSGFNMMRFQNDVSSIEILSEFFRSRDNYCYTRLSEIRKQYIIKSLYGCCAQSDRASFLKIAHQYGVNQSFSYTKLKRYCLLVKEKFMTIIR